MTAHAAQKVLIVDDEPDLALLLKMLLERHGYQTVIAYNGREALAIVEREKVAAIITDIRMPHGDGVELLDAVRAKSYDKPVIVLVSGFSDLTQSEAYHRGAQAIFLKPVDRKAVVQTLERLLLDQRLGFTADTPRIPARFTVDVLLNGSSSDREQVQTVNIGRGGMFMHWPQQALPRQGDEIAFRLRTESPVPRILHGIGVCRWVRDTASGALPRGFGVEFTQVESDDYDALLELIEHIESQAYIPER